jgi:hypothetical protein
MLVVTMGTTSFQNGINIILGYVVGIFMVHWTILCEPPKSLLGFNVLVTSLGLGLNACLCPSFVLD